MHKILALVALASFSMLAQQPEERQLIALDQQWTAALEHKDRATLDRMMAPEYTLADLGGTSNRPPVAKAEWLQNAINFNWHDLAFRSMNAKVYGDVGFVTGTLHFAVTGKIPMISNCEVLDVWVKRDGRWQVVMRRTGAYSLFDHLRWAGGFLVGLATVGFFLFGLRLAKKKTMTV